MQNIVVVEKNELLVNTFDLAKGFETDHRSLRRLIDKYKDDFEDVGERKLTEASDPGLSAFKMPIKNKKGRPTKGYMLNETQSTFVVTLLRNNMIVMRFKKHLTKEFFRQRKLLNMLLVQKQNAEWLEKRASGKIERRLETDTIKEFVEYAKLQGSQSAEKYYMVISKMENCTVFNLDYVTQKFPNLRDLVNGFALDALKMADHTVARALKEGMSKKMDYKEIYQLAKQRVEIFVSAIGRPIIQEVLLQNQKSLESKKVSD